MPVKYFNSIPLVSYNNKDVIDISRRVQILKKFDQSPYAYFTYTVNEGDRPEDVAYYYYGSIDHTWIVLLANNIIDPYSQWPLNAKDLESYIVNKYKDRYKNYAYDNQSSLGLTSEFNSIKSSVASLIYSIITEENVIATLPNTYTKVWEYIQALTSDIKVSDIDSLTVANQYLNENITNFKEHIALIWSPSDLPQRVIDYTKNLTIDDNILYFEGTYDDSGEPIRINRLTYEYSDYVEKGYLDKFGYTKPLDASWNTVRIWDYEEEVNENKRQIKLLNNDLLIQVEQDLVRLMNV